MSAAGEDNRILIHPDYQNGQYGFVICRVGRKVFVPDDVLAALAFGDEELADTITFKTLTEDFSRELDALANTEPWDKRKQERLKETLSNLFARGCASWFRIGTETWRRNEIIKA